MIPLDHYEKWLPFLKENAHFYLNKKEHEEFGLLSEEEIKRQLKDLLEKPIANFTVVNELYFRARWAEVIRTIYHGDDLKLLEVATGDADMIPQVMSCIYPGSQYITANMNKILNQSLLDKTKDLHLKMRVIEDDAAYIEKHIGREYVDVIAFQHAANDVIQAILCDREGIDTIYSDWMETLPKMIEILQKEVKDNTLEQHAKTPFLGLLKTLSGVLKKGGVIAINHYMFQLDLDWGYPADLFENMIPMVRQWMAGLDGCEEIFLEEFDPKWWIFLKKN
ncbi:hypothetical protein [Anaerocolumna sp. MB42-C2]|uniref:hypothetical protein n=1 Tax=Anaerocolumna sp. MB42-C2 TaxID=3070997 RepID=UPI0027DF2EF4|nr:hypothetical protein [Anaerocolumna sp. MB42-C2]WMJ85642.1 hypothetical protein RBU59_16400 [Anaerocolumna sp. MB42-C2]